jgi:hypothetical protein
VNVLQHISSQEAGCKGKMQAGLLLSWGGIKALRLFLNKDGLKSGFRSGFIRCQAD